MSISPCPIVEAVCDVWFDPNVPDEAVYGALYQIFRHDFPRASALPGAIMPTELRQANPALKHQAQYRLEAEDLVVLVGSHNIAVGMRGQYPGWPKLKDGFQRTLSLAVSSKVILRPVRFGLRYINFFSGNVLSNLKLSFSLEKDVLVGENVFFKIVLPDESCKLNLQVANQIMLPNIPNQAGSLIDIDAFTEQPGGLREMEASLLQFLEKAHLAEKRLFFSLLRDEFLETLNPTY